LQAAADTAPARDLPELQAVQEHIGGRGCVWQGAAWPAVAGQ